MIQGELSFEEPEYIKRCPQCKEYKVAEVNFYKDKGKKDGYDGRCKACCQTPRRKFSKLKDGARSRGYEWELNLHDASGLMLDDCYYCGKPSKIGIKIHGLDRINNDVGYQKDNIVPCCEQCNRAKLSDTKEDFIEMCKRVAQRHTSYEKSNMESRKVYLENMQVGEIFQENFDYPVW